MKTTFRQSFSRDLKDIRDRKILHRVEETIKDVEDADSLTEIKNLKKLRGGKNHYRIRIGDFRIGLTLKQETVEFVRCLSRKDLYRYFP